MPPLPGDRGGAQQRHRERARPRGDPYRSERRQPTTTTAAAPTSRTAGRRHRAKSAADHGGPVLERLALAELLADGGYDRRLRTVRRPCRSRRDAALAAIAAHLPGARVTGVAAGRHLVVTLPSTVDDRLLADEAAAAGLGALALSAPRVSAAGPPGLVLGYAACSIDRFRDAVQVLGALIG